MGCGQPAGEAGLQHRPRRRRSWPGSTTCPGVTVNRYCSSSLQTIRMAAHAIKAGEGDCFIAAGVETVSRYGGRRQRHGAERRSSSRPASARPSGRRAAAPAWTPPEGLPDIYIAMGQTAENVVEAEKRHPRGDGRVRQALAGPRRRQRRERLLRRGDHAGHAARRHRRVEGRRPTAPARRSRGWPAQAGVPPRRHGHGRQRLPAQRRRRRGARDERHQGGASSASRRWRGSCRPGVSALNPEIMGLGPIEASRQALARAGMTIDDIDLVEINEAFAAQVIPSAKHLGIDVGQAQRARRRRSPSATRSA